MCRRVLHFAVFVVVLLLVAARFAAELLVAADRLLRYRDRAWDDDGRSSV